MKNGIKNLIKKDKRIYAIELNDGTMLEEIMGILGLNDGGVLSDDNSHCVSFFDKKDLMNILKHDIVGE